MYIYYSTQEIEFFFAFNTMHTVDFKLPQTCILNYSIHQKAWIMSNFSHINISKAEAVGVNYYSSWYHIHHTMNCCLSYSRSGSECKHLYLVLYSYQMLWSTTICFTQNIVYYTISMHARVSLLKAAQLHQPTRALSSSCS